MRIFISCLVSMCLTVGFPTGNTSNREMYTKIDWCVELKWLGIRTWEYYIYFCQNRYDFLWNNATFVKKSLRWNNKTKIYVRVFTRVKVTSRWCVCKKQIVGISFTCVHFETLPNATRRTLPPTARHNHVPTAKVSNKFNMFYQLYLHIMNHNGNGRYIITLPTYIS